MVAIQIAFASAIRSAVPRLQNGWWGCLHKNIYYIMRYNHSMVAFTYDECQIQTCETKSDRDGIAEAIQLIIKWQNQQFNQIMNN